MQVPQEASNEFLRNPIDLNRFSHALKVNT